MIPLKDDNPTTSVPYITMGLIAANLFAFTYMLVIGAEGSERILLDYAAVPARMFGKSGDVKLSWLATPVSSMFLHGNLLHVGGNMLYLWIFGDNVEDALGHAGYLAFYVACGLAAALAHGLTDTSSTVPMIGASGAVSGILGAYMLLYPRARVWTFFFFLFFWQVLRVPAVVVIGLWIVLQLVNGITDFGRMSGGVAWFAHIGGFVFGLLFIFAVSGSKRIRRIRR